MKRTRLRDLGISIGDYPVGPHNAITDVLGIRVGHATIISDAPHVVRTGVTIIMPGDGNIWEQNLFAGFHMLNGAGEVTGVHWLNESGLLCSPIGLTNTHQIGLVRDSLAAYAQTRGYTDTSALPVVGETWDGWLSDLDALAVESKHVMEALGNARSGPVDEGNVGAGTGLICYDFKGGIGTSSRVVDGPAGSYVVGALVQANHGDRSFLRIDGRPIGRALGVDRVPSPWTARPAGGSTIVVIATDAPLLSIQCRRLAQRAVIGFARTGGVGHDGSGDMFLAFSTANVIPLSTTKLIPTTMFPNSQIDGLFEAAAEAVEEAILNALISAETMTGYMGRTAFAIPIEALGDLVNTK